MKERKENQGERGTTGTVIARQLVQGRCGTAEAILLGGDRTYLDRVYLKTNERPWDQKTSRL